jgi:hypothetical protein
VPNAAGRAFLPRVRAFELRRHLSAGTFPAKGDDSFAGRSACVVLLPHERGKVISGKKYHPSTAM